MTWFVYFMTMGNLTNIPRQVTAACSSENVIHMEPYSKLAELDPEKSDPFFWVKIEKGKVESGK